MDKCGRVIASLLITLALGMWSGRAQALNFDFSFTGDSSHPGTVTGQIFGLQPDGSSQATRVVIDTSTIPLPVSLPYDFFHDPTLSEPVNNFIVSGGEIFPGDATLGIAADYKGSQTFISLSFNALAGFEDGTHPVWVTSLDVYVGGNLVDSIADFASFSPSTLVFTPVPEPGSMAILGAGLAIGFCAMGRGSRRAIRVGGGLRT